MWKLDSDYNKWNVSSDNLSLENFEFLKQELSSVRFYSKCLSGATYLPLNDLDDIYDVLSVRKSRDFYISTNGSPYSDTLIPSQFASPITSTSSFDYYTRNLSEYNLTLKNLFTPYRLMKDSLKNYIYVDVATTEPLVNLLGEDRQRTIDDVRLVNGHKVLVKNQLTIIVLQSTIIPDEYFRGNYRITQNLGATIEYEYLNEENGIYEYRDGILVKTNELNDYERCKRFSVVVKEGLINKGIQFHLLRLRNGYFPSVVLNDPFEFQEKKNWILRNRVDYNNLFEINYYDVIKHGPQSYALSGFTYSIPERVIAVGEFGVIINYQKGVQNIINNKYKVNLRSISQTNKFYWICGDDGVLLRVRKHDFEVTRIEVDCLCPRKLVRTNLRSISFFDDLRGSCVGDLNTILVTDDGGNNWQRIRIEAFDKYYFNKVIFYSNTTFFVGGNNGVFLELFKDITGWSALRRRISRFVDEEEEYILVDNINDMFLTTFDNWGLTFSYTGQTSSNPKEILMIVGDDSKIIAYDIKNTVPQYDFLYLDFQKKYGDIRNITRQGTSSNFYFTGIDETTLDSGIFNFSINNFQYIGIGNSYSNSILSATSASFLSDLYSNRIFDYNGQELFICGNESLLQSSTYSNSLNFDILDNNFENRLKSKLLFLDYDVASKLNFFTDFGDYRLPEQQSFSFTASNGYFLDFQPLINSATAPSFVTQSEHNWFTYWRESSSTFEFYSDSPIDNSSKVGMSSKFSYSTFSTTTITKITTTSSHITALAPKILDTESSRFNGFGMTSIVSPTFSADLYLYDYLMVARFDLSFSVNVGDVLRLESTPVTGNFVVNKLKTLSGKKYAYMFTEFNESILKELQTTTQSVKLTNLNRFQTLSQLKERFDYHPISVGYELNLSSDFEQNLINLDFRFGGATQSYTEFTFAGDFITYSYSSFVDGNVGLRTGSTGTSSITSPTIQYCDELQFWYFYPAGIQTLETTSLVVQAYSPTSSTWVNIFQTILPNTARPGRVFKRITNLGSYNQFRFTIVTGLCDVPAETLRWIGIDSVKFISGSKILADDTTYGLTSSLCDFVNIEAKFNNLTAYYNLGQVIKTPYYEYEMRYRSSFLKFGYTPTFNLLDYLESINDIGDPNPKFYANKEYFAMPHYEKVPMPGISNFNEDQIYIDYNTYDNRLLFGTNRKLEWESLLINTFVDINLYDDGSEGSSPSSTTERLLIIDKFIITAAQNGLFEQYVIEFDRAINYTENIPLYFIDILSRRKLSQISEDLQILNNIQRLQNKKVYDTSSSSLFQANFSNFERYYNFKINTDSYAKYMLSDFSTLDNISAVIYTDYKNEFSMNITKLDVDFSIPIQNTANYLGKLFISCSQKHELKTGDGVVLEFTGGTNSSQDFNPQYFGYHPVIVVNQYNFYVDIPYGKQALVGSDKGFVKYVKRDPFLYYQPVDLIEVGVDKRGRQSIELFVENTKLIGNKFSLTDVDFRRFRFRLIDGLDLDYITTQFSWILEAEISDAIIGQDANGLVWYKGTWECGRWFGGTWISGAWISGDWYNGVWKSNKIKDNFINVGIDEVSSNTTESTWFSGRWYDGVWSNGTWVNGRWYGGTWNDGEWYKGIWNDGTWNNGKFLGGIWVDGNWNQGIFNCDNEPAYWLDGNWNGGDFENGMWFNGIWQEQNTAARFGVNAYNSRTAIWHGGKWLSGSFHSKTNINNNGLHDVSETHQYSVWYTGTWQNGDFYGGIVYNIDFKSGIWYGGILEDIQVIGFTGSNTTSNNFFTLNGIFRFNIGDEITIIDNQIGNTYSVEYGSNSIPKSYRVLYTVEDPVNKWTHVYVNKNITYRVDAPVDLGLRVVSTFRNCNWKSGIWTNGIYEAGLWEGGIWYGGVFNQNATWM